MKSTIEELRNAKLAFWEKIKVRETALNASMGWTDDEAHEAEIASLTAERESIMKTATLWEKIRVKLIVWQPFFFLSKITRPAKHTAKDAAE